MERYPHLKQSDPEIYELIRKQADYESGTLKMIASESYASFSVLEACGSTLTNKYAEGYPGARYYEGNEFVDKIENLAIERGKALFGAEHINVQPYSGSPANHAVYQALLKTGDKLMGMPVPSGGHLTHGWKANFSGTDYVQIPYGPDPGTGKFDMDQIRETARKERPKMIWVGATAYPHKIEYKDFRAVADEIDAYLVADIAHINALIIAGVHPDPVPVCDIVTSTSHKMLRGPRAGFLLSKTEDRFQQKYFPGSKLNLAQRVDRAVFPGLQGGPHLAVIAAMAAAFKEASTPEFKEYGRQIVKNAKALAEAVLAKGYALAGGGTDTHLLILDFRKPVHGRELTGKEAAKALAEAGIIANFNMVPGDHRSPFVTSGVRLGTPSLTAMGMKEPEMQKIAGWIDRVCKNIAAIETEAPKIRQEIAEFCKQFTVPGIRSIL
ncbi:MAG: serine hydroxymethyltransferase [Planctomycetaceae bacterium]|jgi:glycine hydroxymethyltransferase|nr:serine hydroxymethyltransferase [Planctomycetaceae bacterium]